jgi:hypothetical protein
MSKLDVWFWFVTLSEVKMCAPTTLQQRLSVVEDQTAAMDTMDAH